MTDPILELTELSMPWVGLDPFIFTVHHHDHYPPGNEQQGPAASLGGRRLGADFSYLDGWSMYHGSIVPGFPQHPHRGFETVTVVRRGYVDHSDSLGATARYGQGDTQWLTAGAGIQHAEMFPLTDDSGPNELELFQIWLNLPPASKMVPAYFRMLWSEEIPTVVAEGGLVTVDLIAGRFEDFVVPAPPPDSWASQPGSDLAIWLIRLAPEAGWLLPPAPPGVNRMLHFFDGAEVSVGSTRITVNTGVRLHPEVAAPLTNHGGPAEFLLLQGRPIGAPVFQMGPFVMNSPEEIAQALADYRATGFGGWPWDRPDPVHDRHAGRFALHVDGRTEYRDPVDRLSI
ncbi:MAG TPA: pirin family protein [Acidimicrobiia bacterium]|nr:pirin family protein [Acidimicrobiia bacterium]